MTLHRRRNIRPHSWSSMRRSGPAAIATYRIRQLLRSSDIDHDPTDERFLHRTNAEPRFLHQLFDVHRRVGDQADTTSMLSVNQTEQIMMFLDTSSTPASYFVQVSKIANSIWKSRKCRQNDGDGNLRSTASFTETWTTSIYILRLIL